RGAGALSRSLSRHRLAGQACALQSSLLIGGSRPRLAGILALTPVPICGVADGGALLGAMFFARLDGCRRRVGTAAPPHCPFSPVLDGDRPAATRDQCVE